MPRLSRSQSTVLRKIRFRTFTLRTLLGIVAVTAVLIACSHRYLTLIHHNAAVAQLEELGATLSRTDDVVLCCFGPFDELPPKNRLKEAWTTLLGKPTAHVVHVWIRRDTPGDAMLSMIPHLQSLIPPQVSDEYKDAPIHIHVDNNDRDSLENAAKLQLAVPGLQVWHVEHLSSSRTLSTPMMRPSMSK